MEPPVSVGCSIRLIRRSGWLSESRSSVRARAPAHAAFPPFSECPRARCEEFRRLALADSDDEGDSDDDARPRATPAPRAKAAVEWISELTEDWLLLPTVWGSK